MDGEKNISVIIPYYECDPGKKAVLKRCVDSLSWYDELIIVWNDKMGYAKPINKGLELAKGDYIIVMNDDIVLREGELSDLCLPRAVTSPVVNGISQPFFGCCFCIPRDIYEKIGGMDENYRISYFDDDDYIMKLKTNLIPMVSVDSVKIDHLEGGRTLHSFPDHNEFFEENKNYFQKKWQKYL